MEKVDEQIVEKHFQKISEDLIELLYGRLHDFIYIYNELRHKIFR
jgi:hypothetical protein